MLRGPRLGLTYLRDTTQPARPLDVDQIRELRPDVIRLVVQSVAELVDRCREIQRAGATVAFTFALPVERWRLAECESAFMALASCRHSLEGVELGHDPRRHFTEAVDYVEHADACADMALRYLRLGTVYTLPAGHIRSAADREWNDQVRECASLCRHLDVSLARLAFSAVGDGWPRRRTALRVPELLGRGQRFTVEIGWPIGQALTLVDSCRAYALDWLNGRRMHQPRPRDLDDRLRGDWLRAAWTDWRDAGAEVVYVRGMGADAAIRAYSVAWPAVGHGWRDLRLASRGLGTWSAKT